MQEEKCLRHTEYQAVVSSVQNSLKRKQENIKLTDEERYDVGKYSPIHAASSVVRKLKRSHPQLQSVTKALRLAPPAPYSMLDASLLAYSWPKLSGIAFPDLTQH